jgi:hypothetical protein
MKTDYRITFRRNDEDCDHIFSAETYDEALKYANAYMEQFPAGSRIYGWTFKHY